jgi:peptidoglycan/LPS O-acetylase OafA/YrhL
MDKPELRFTQLDGLRFFAVAAVILQHYTPLGAYEHAINIGMFGVQLFFVLSGFLISGILLDLRADRGGPPHLLGVVGRFYARRALRIFPAYYLLCAVLLATGFKAMWSTWPWQLLYLSDIGVVVNGGFPGAISHFWSLSVEEQFYLIWPWLMLLMPLRSIPAVCAGAIAVGLTSRILVTVYDVPFGGILAVCNLDALAAGAWVAYANREQRDGALLNFLGSGVGLGCTVLFVLALHVAKYQPSPFTSSIIICMNTAMAVMWASLVLQASRGFHGATGWLLTWRPITYLGQISYGIYLFHNIMLPLIQLKVMPRLGLTSEGVIPVVAAVVASVIIAALSFHLFERPLSELKRFFPYRARPQATAIPNIT